MRSLYVYSLFDNVSGRPCCTGIRAGGRTIIRDLYRPGSGKTIKTINDAKKEIKDIILKVNSANKQIITSDFKSHIHHFDLPLFNKAYNVYDMHLPDIKYSGMQSKDVMVVRKVLDKLEKSKPKEYNKIMANAAVVYQNMENNGVLLDYELVHPKWSQKTFSGRSKTTGFNIQGTTDKHGISFPGSENYVFIHFDWICADIRVASVLSGDSQLWHAFDQSDPYSHMQDVLTKKSTGTGTITRDECKLHLLKSINSMDTSSIALDEVYPQLGKWIKKCKRSMQNGDGNLNSLLHRKFRVKYAKNNLAVLNGAMQGSVAHAMQITIRKIWELVGDRLVAEIHDSLVICSRRDPKSIKSTIDAVAPAMLYPFKDILDDNPSFPFRVSIGKTWKKWVPYLTYRESGAKNAT